MILSTIQTIFLLYSALSLAAGILIASLFWGKNDLSAKLWIYGCFLTSIATSVTVFRNEIPVVISYSLMVSFELLSILLFSESLKRLSNNVIDKNIHWITLVVPTSLFLVVEIKRFISGGMVTPDITAISTFAFGAGNLYCLYQVRIVSKDFSNRIFFNFLAVIFGLSSMLYFLRVLNVFTGYSGFVFDLKPYNLIIWFSLSLLNSIRNLTYIVLRLHLGLSEYGRLNNMNIRLSNSLEERNGMIMSLQKLNKSASINALASTIAHEINQPLGATRLNAQFAEMKLESDPGNVSLFKDLIRTILSDINRASTIVQNLSRITANKGSVVTKVSVQDSVNEVIEISLSKLRASKIELKFECADEHQIAVNQSEWQQVLINLLNNAIEALEQNESKQKTIAILVTKRNTNIEISIEDSGPGIPESHQSQIFELLVTNKDAGSGIGLWLSKNIINRFGGNIKVHNKIDGGACFVIELPSA